MSQRKKNNNTAKTITNSKPTETTVPNQSRPVISRRRKWLFRLAAMTIPLVLFFALTETGLRLGGYGYQTTFFVGPDSHGLYKTNECFGWRFFPRSIARAPNAYDISTKPAGTIRIFVIGSSAAMGTPNFSFGFGRILEVMLNNKYPETRFEVVNAAMTAINSHVAREIARDCAAHQPDIFVVYMGNNEVIGPYGPGTVFQKWSPNLMLVRANIWVKATRIGQLIGNFIGYFRSNKSQQTEWGGMEMYLANKIAKDDPRLDIVYKNYQQNLTEICKIAKQSGAGIILSTVATNLRDCPPLASVHRSDLNAENLTKWDSLYQAGVKLEVDHKWPEAIAQYEEAAKIDDQFADLCFRLGRCLFAAGRYSEARDRFILARDLDALRFRADGRINTSISEVAADQNSSAVKLVDAEKELANSELAPHSIPGEELFYEHVHLTFDGNYLLARSVLDKVCELLPQAVSSGKTGPVLTRQQCAEALALTPFDEYQMADNIDHMTSRPPFTNQLDHDIRQALAAERTKKLRQLAVTPKIFQTSWNTYQSALSKSPDDLDLHLNFANLASHFSRFDVAAEHLQIVVQKRPWSLPLCLSLADVLIKCQKYDEAIVYYEKALQINPNSVEVRNDLGQLLFRLGRTQAAIEQLKKALKINADDMNTHHNIGIALACIGQNNDAITHLRRAIELKSNNEVTYYTLGLLLSRIGQNDEAVVNLQKSLEIKPDYAEAHKLLGEVCLSMGKTQEASIHLDQALQLMPDKDKTETK